MISLIATVKNEKDNLSSWFASFANQTKRPDEIVIVDGGSTDGTWKWLQEMASKFTYLRVFQKKGNISVGRNKAIFEAQGDIIVVADAGCVYDREWFMEITSPFEEGFNFVTTAFKPFFKREHTLIHYLIATSTVPRKEEFTKNWLASSRSVAFTKKLWQIVGGYPEWLPICEDVVFDLKISQKQAQIAYIRQTLVSWAPRSSLRAYLKQLYLYTKGDGHAKLFFGRQVIRYLVYFSSIFLLVLGSVNSYYWFGILFLGMIVYLKKFYLRFFSFSQDLNFGKKILGILVLPFVIVMGDIFKMLGWPVGVFERLTGDIKFQL